MLFFLARLKDPLSRLLLCICIDASLTALKIVLYQSVIVRLVSFWEWICDIKKRYEIIMHMVKESIAACTQNKDNIKKTKSRGLK